MSRLDDLLQAVPADVLAARIVRWENIEAAAWRVLREAPLVTSPELFKRLLPELALALKGGEPPTGG